MKTITCLILALAALPAAAAVDLDACTRDGQPIAQELCRSLRQADASSKSAQARTDAEKTALQRAKDRSAAFEAEQARKRDVEAAQRAEQRTAEAAAAAYWSEKSQALKQSVAERERQAEAQERVARKVCGADYGMPKVGMSLARARSCLGDSRLVGQVNRADGVASVYATDSLQLVVMDGKVVAWQGLR
ncbi:hypothetical protein ACG04Q_11990 [Roseateles sp. DXS20W]|uniref:DUF4124 domain-containing protein n=1 Tax=Pelomonas lactea TaxID=3299030 RepID=A0ABW7GK07_9BURK